MMSAEEAQQREAYVKAALEYLGTPYHHGGQVKGVGVDCSTLLLCAAKDSGLIEKFDLPPYPPHWHLHRGGEKLLAVLTKLCVEVPHPALPGDIIVWKFGRSFSHAAIVIQWPQIVHCYIGKTCCLDDATANKMLSVIGEAGPNVNKPRPTKLLSRWSR